MPFSSSLRSRDPGEALVCNAGCCLTSSGLSSLLTVTSEVRNLTIIHVHWPRNVQRYTDPVTPLIILSNALMHDVISYRARQAIRKSIPLFFSSVDLPSMFPLSFLLSGVGEYIQYPVRTSSATSCLLTLRERSASTTAGQVSGGLTFCKHRVRTCMRHRPSSEKLGSRRTAFKSAG